MTKTDPLIGYYFLSFKIEYGEKVLYQQGQIMYHIEPDIYLVDIFDWFMGDYYTSRIVSRLALQDYMLFQDKENMVHAVKGLRKKNGY